MLYLVLALFLAVGLAMILRWLVTAQPAQVRKALLWTGGLIGGAALLLFLLRGGASVLWWLALVAAPMAMRWRNMLATFRNIAKAARGPSPGQTSSVRTDRIAMTLDHDSGAMEGEVLAGRFAGRQLADLTRAELLDLLAECRDDDPQSARLVESYLDRVHGADWHEAAEDSDSGAGHAGATADPGAMTREQALAVLGLTEGAGEDEVREAHRRLMMANHPDRGGSSFIASQINRAKDVLLGRA